MNGESHTDRTAQNSAESGSTKVEPLRRPRIHFSELPTLSTQYKPAELIEILNFRGFVNLLDSKNTINEKSIMFILKIISKAMEAKESDRLNPFLSAVGSKSVFFRMHLKEYLEQIEEQVNENETLSKEVEQKIDSIGDILSLIKQLLVKFPHETNMSSRPLSALIKIIRQIHHKAKLKDSLQQILSDVEEEMDTVKKMIENANAVNVVKPPNDFRQISVVPVLSDIKEETQDIFLRKNVVDEKYESVDHYLDVQFRLMREDFLRPLREGIKQYLNALENKQRIRRLENAFIYYNVRIMEMEFSEFGLEIRMQLDLLTLPRIKWKTTKRLMSGSLICFSWNRFEDFIIATVSGQRKEELLERGYFSAIIDPSHETKIMNVINEDPDKNFVIIEPLSYFEAYKHILSSLQTFNESNFPLSKYIVNLNTKIDSPAYINDSTTYDFKSFLTSFMQESNCDNSDDDWNGKIEEKSEPQSSALVSRLSEVNILDKSSWPTAEEFRMDESQLNALKDALTREVSIIQGPPGTGKTFIGLRIVEALMNNRQYWDADDSGTILVACYTNHALDQFLEGILPLCNKILRIGGRCRNDNLKKYCLKEMKLSFRRSVP
ncbi:NFX1-type zinc finger-containing protein 1-like protein, partial [Leptotrombidium deliense]